MQRITSHARRVTAGLAVAGLGLAGLAIAPANATAVSVPIGSAVDTGFSGTGDVYDTSGFGPGTQQFDGTSNTVTFDFSGYSFTGDAPILNYTPTAFEGLLQPSDITIGDGDFMGTDVLTVDANDALDVNLSGTFTGPGGTLPVLISGEEYTFTGTATETGGTGIFQNADSTLPFLLTELETGPPITSSAVPAPNAPPSPNATYTALYGPAALAVPESGSVSLLALGLLPLGLIAKKRLSRRA